MKLKLSIDSRKSEPINQQLYEQLRRLILDGKLKSGEKMPSSRELAQLLNISRPTIAAGVKQLVAEGYLESRHGSGCYVAELETAVKKGRKSRARLSDYARFIDALPEGVPATDDCEISFHCWRPALDQFPLSDWARLLGRCARTPDMHLLDNDWDAQGNAVLRRSIAGLVKRYRGIKCSPEQIILVMGLNQGLDLAARLHLTKGLTAAVENPSYPLSWSIFAAYGARVAGIPVDEEGLCTERLPPQAGLIYVTPSRQFPMGVVLPIARRMELLEWAQRSNAIIVEDDYDSEYHDEGRPIPALMSLDKNECVVYLGTLNQLMYPNLGLGYLIVPHRMVDTYRKARLLAGAHLPLHLQMAIAEFIDSGDLDRHVKRLRALYKDRRNTLVGALKKRLGELVEVRQERSGVFVIARFKTRLSAATILNRAAEAGVSLTSTEDFYLRHAPRNEFILGFGSLSERQIIEGVSRLARILKR
jgi:GntR family transcriptional regulator/MocR family aminotransferase